MRYGITAVGLSALLLSSLAWADGDHGAHVPKGAAPLWIWGVGGALLLIVAVVLIRQAKQGTLIG